AALGAAALIAGGVLALTADASSSASDWAGPALITLGVASFVGVYFVTRKVLAAHREQPVRGGAEELVGASAEARTPLDRDGQGAIAGGIGRARMSGGGASPQPGDRVRVEAVEGLTLVVRPEPPPQTEAPATSGRPDPEEGAN